MDEISIIKRAVVLLRGGLDSVVLAHLLVSARLEVRFLLVDDGRSGVGCALRCAQRLGVKLDVVDINFARDQLYGKIEPTPSRAELLLAIGCAEAANEHAYAVALGAHKDDHAFSDAVSALDSSVRLLVPFAIMAKHEVVDLGHLLNVPLHDTWSCHHDARLHCGACAGCEARQAAFMQAGVADSTVYAHEINGATKASPVR